MNKRQKAKKDQSRRNECPRKYGPNEEGKSQNQ